MASSVLLHAGGLCSRYSEYFRSGKRIYESLNTGVVTIVKYGKELPPRISHFARHIGHSLGAEHDTGDICAPHETARPDSDMANYIMFNSVNAGDFQNNYENNYE